MAQAVQIRSVSWEDAMDAYVPFLATSRRIVFLLAGLAAVAATI